MTAVFSHGRLRLYLLKLLAEGPKHGYELIRLLENRFLGLYTPSAGTIYPRLQRMESEELVTHRATGGRKVYEITEAGRSELIQRGDELAELESEIHASVADLTTLASEIEQQVSGSVRDLKRELRDVARQARTVRSSWQPPRGHFGPEYWDRDRPGSRERAEARERSGAPERDAVGDLERAAGELAAQVHKLARRAGVSEPELRAATAVVTSALTELRRLLRG
jgi:DNA-binding PadR family transcriptional regulator